MPKLLYVENLDQNDLTGPVRAVELVRFMNVDWMSNTQTWMVLLSCKHEFHVKIEDASIVKFRKSYKCPACPKV